MMQAAFSIRAVRSQFFGFGKRAVYRFLRRQHDQVPAFRKGWSTRFARFATEGTALDVAGELLSTPVSPFDLRLAPKLFIGLRHRGKGIGDLSECRGRGFCAVFERRPGLVARMA